MKEKQIGQSNISANEINREANRNGNQYFNLNDSGLRRLAGKPTGEIKFSDFRGKSLSMKSWRLHQQDYDGKKNAHLYYLNAYDKHGRVVFSTGYRSLDGVNNHYSGNCNPDMKDIARVDLQWYRDTKSHGTSKMWLFITDHNNVEHLILAYDKHKGAFKAHPTRTESVTLGTEDGNFRSYKIELKL